MDVLEKVDLVAKPPTEEIVTIEELTELFKTNSKPKHYIGIEISGFLHLGSLISTGYKINDFMKAGVDCTVFLADWHTLINDKLGGNWENISKVSKYYEDAYRQVCPGVKIVRGSELYEEKKEYWAELVRFTKHMTLSRTKRALDIMGRSYDDEKMNVAKLLYPPMQAVDIHFLELDIAHAGMDQRKIHMLVRENFPKMGWKVPVSVHHSILPGLNLLDDLSRKDGGARYADGQITSKMSKSNPNSTIFIHDSPDEIKSKIKKSWCEEGIIKNNPLLAISKQIIFHENNEMNIERPDKFGGNVSYSSYEELELDFENKKLHPMDLKQTVTKLLTPIVSSINEKLTLSDEISDIIKNSV